MTGTYNQFISGFSVTISVFGLSVICGTSAGLWFAVCATSRLTYVRSLVRLYVGVVRGVPELLIILMVFFGGTTVLSAVVGRYVEVNAFAAGTAALTAVFSAYAEEVFRGALDAISKGQIEAAKALGLSAMQRFALVVVPQMIPLALPSYANLCISLVKDTALVSIVGLSDVMRVAYVDAGSFRAPLPFYLAAAAIYLACTTAVLVGFKFLDRHFDHFARAPQ